MSFILTLISSNTPLSIAHVERAEAFVQAHGIGLGGKPGWIKAHVAADLPIANSLTLEQMRELRAAFEDNRIDVLCVAKDGRRKKLLVADMDATIVTCETLDELAAKAGLKDRISSITDRAMRGEIDFPEALRMRVALLKGLPVSALEETLKEIVLTDGAKELTAAMKAGGADCVLVSGGFSYFTGDVAAQAGFDAHHGNDLHIDGGVISGTVGESILGKEAKLAYLISHASARGLDMAETVAIGDGANDLAMLSAAGLGIGFHPKPVLEENLLNVLKYSDLRGVLYAQGISG